MTAQPADETRTLAPAAVHPLRARLRGPLLQPGDDGYDAARTLWNGMFDRRPALIAQCAGAADVIAAVAFAREHDLPIAVRGGAHSAAGKSVCDGGLVVDLSRMRGIRVDPAARIARAEAGLTWGDLDHETQAFGLAVTGGQVSHTGIAGLTLGGGFGWLVRKLGFTVDSLLAVDLVTADGQLLHASEQENADLFWGVRGAGANFGVVTSFEYRLHPIGPIVTGGLALFPAERALEVLLAFRTLMADAPDELMILAVALTAPPAPFVPEWLRGRPAVALGVCHCGSLAEGERAVAPIRALGPAADLIGPMPYVALQRLIDEAVPFGLHYYEKAAYLGRLDDEAIAVWADQMARMTSPLSMGVLFALGGAIARLPEDAMAMGNRDSAYGYTAVSAWDGAEGPEAAARHIAWSRGVSSAMEPYATGRTYVNFLGHGDEDRVRAAYNPASYERLVALKRRYDPENVFHLNANIRP